jgi:hypothetical protein
MQSMSGVYKLINLFLFLGFAGLLALLTHRITSVVELPAFETGTTQPQAAETPGPESAASSPPSARVQRNFGSYSQIVDQNLFSADRKPWIDAGPTPTPDVSVEPTPQEEAEFDTRGLHLTGTVLLGATKLAFFDESGVQAPAPAMPAMPGMPAVSGAPVGAGRPGAAAPSRLQQKLLEQQRRIQAAKIQEAIRNGQPIQPGVASGVMPGGPGGLGYPGTDAASADSKPSTQRHGYREGEQVAGFKIEEIRAVDVVLSQDGKQGTLKLEEETAGGAAGAAGAGAGPIPLRPPQAARPQVRGQTPQQQLKEQQRLVREQQRRIRDQRRQQQLARRRAGVRVPEGAQPQGAIPPQAEAPPPEGEVLPEDQGGEGDVDGTADDGTIEEEPDQPAQPGAVIDEK